MPDTFDPTLMLAVLAALALFALHGWRTMRARADGIEAAALRARLRAGEDVLVLDVRTPAEFTGELGHIEGAVNLPLAELPERLAAAGDDLAAYKDATLVVVCRTQNRSLKALARLRRMGFSKSWILRGGMVAWNAARLPVFR